jgi:L,D-transpeptidase catalytic domain
MKCDLSILCPLLVGIVACGVAGPDASLDDEGGGSDSVAASGGAGAGEDMPGGAGAGAAGGGGGGITSGGGGGGEPDCPAGVICVGTFPFAHSATTTGAASDQFDSYGCGPQNESGPEVVYRVDVPSEGFLWLDLSDLPAGVDVDLHLLASLDPDDCLDRGHWEVGQLLPAGSYYVVVDTWVDANDGPADGAYTLGIGVTTVQDLTGWGVSPAVAADALHVFDRAWDQGQVDTSAYAVVDFAVHASQPRMWVFDVFDAALRHQTYTTVGDMSDPDGDGWADIFSNQSGSHQSSLGLMKGAELYSGTYGNSMRLDGLELGYNDDVRPRAIVVHPWTGSDPAYATANPSGAAPTWGCLGIDPAIVDDLRAFLANGGLILSHFPDGDWSTDSSFMP